MIEFFQSLLQLDVTINTWAQMYGPYLYLVLFLIIFCETGLVVTPFLPGDSLLFAVGALSASSIAISPTIIIPLLITAALLGDSLNYFIGYKYGRKLFETNSFFFRQKYLTDTEAFYEKHGTKAVFLARFFPIVRTFAPFVAGIGKMPYKNFVSMSFFGSIAWINIFVLAGYFFGQIEFIRKNFTLLILSLILLPAVPIVIATLKSILKKKQ